MRSARSTRKDIEGRVVQRRIGMLTPSSNTALEPLTYALLEGVPGASVHFSRLKHLTSTPEQASLDQFRTSAFLDAAALLADAEVDVIAWNGTSGSWLGPTYDRKVCGLIESAFGIPATTSTLAILDALSFLGAKRYGLAVPYLEEHATKIIDTYAAQGLTCVTANWLGLVGNHDLDLVPAEVFGAQLAAVAQPDTEAIVVACTGVPTAKLVDEFEARLSIPVVDSVIVTAWHCLQMLRLRPTAAGWGRVFSSLIP